MAEDLVGAAMQAAEPAAPAPASNATAPTAPASGPKESDRAPGESRWWQSLLWAVVCFAGGIWMFNMFDDLEKHGGSIRLNFILIGIYKVLGKWGVLAFFTVAALGFAYTGVSRYRKDKAAA
jgi:hypothetical protein